MVVRARANDAKFIGTAVGGIAVAVKDFYTGRILADGMIAGGTGNTRLLMQKPLSRGEQIAGKKAASFTTILDISKFTALRGQILFFQLSIRRQNDFRQKREKNSVPLVYRKNLICLPA